MSTNNLPVPFAAPAHPAPTSKRSLLPSIMSRGGGSERHGARRASAVDRWAHRRGATSPTWTSVQGVGGVILSQRLGPDWVPVGFIPYGLDRPAELSVTLPVPTLPPHRRVPSEAIVRWAVADDALSRHYTAGSLATLCERVRARTKTLDPAHVLPVAYAVALETVGASERVPGMADGMTTPGTIIERYGLGELVRLEQQLLGLSHTACQLCGAHGETHDVIRDSGGRCLCPACFTDAAREGRATWTREAAEQIVALTESTPTDFACQAATAVLMQLTAEAAGSPDFY